MKKLVIIVLVIVGALVVSVIAASSKNPITTINIGPYRLEVPNANRPDLSPFSWVYSIAGLDESSDSLIFEFSGEEVAEAIPGYVFDVDGIDQKVIGLMTHINLVEQKRFLDNLSYREAWEATEGYENRHIVKDEKTGYYLVTEKEGYWGIFVIFADDPNQEIPMPKYSEDFLLSSCTGSPLYPFKQVGCTETLLLFDNNISVQYSYSYENIANHKAIKSFVKEKLTSWLSN